MIKMYKYWSAREHFYIIIIIIINLFSLHRR